MIISKCKKCGGSFWQTAEGSREEDLCDQCENSSSSLDDEYPAALSGKLCWIPAAWASGTPPMPRPRPHHFLMRTAEGYFLHGADGELRQHPLVTEPLSHGQQIAFVAYRVIGTHMLDVGRQYHDCYYDPNPVANSFTLNLGTFDIASSYQTIAALVERGNSGQRLASRTYSVFSSWWSNKLYRFEFRAGPDGAAHFIPLINSDFLIAYCDDRGHIETSPSMDRIPEGSFAIARGGASAITAMIDARAEQVDAEPYVPEMRDFAHLEDRIRHLELWLGLSSPLEFPRKRRLIQ